MRDFNVKVAEVSKDITVKERIMLKDTSNALKLDELTQESENGKVNIDCDYYAILEVHNEMSENKDYKLILIVDKQGQKYVTGSDSFTRAFLDIYEEMTEAGETDITIEVFRKESKNYKGKQFLICSII